MTALSGFSMLCQTAANRVRFGKRLKAACTATGCRFYSKIDGFLMENGPNTTLGSLETTEPYINRNPRNLELMGIAKKTKGWEFQFPRRDFYHKIMFEQTGRHTSGRVVHCSGNTVLQASTHELAVSHQLSSTRDTAAAWLVGAVLARRCLQTGIHCAVLDPEAERLDTKKISTFLGAMQETGVELQEPRWQQAPELPGCDYDARPEAPVDPAELSRLSSADRRALEVRRRQRSYYRDELPEFVKVHARNLLRPKRNKYM